MHRISGVPHYLVNGVEGKHRFPLQFPPGGDNLSQPNAYANAFRLVAGHPLLHELLQPVHLTTLDERRLELVSLPNQGGEFRCPVCGEVLEVFNGDEAFVAHRLTVTSQKKKPGATAAPGELGAAGPKGSEDLASR